MKKLFIAVVGAGAVAVGLAAPAGAAPSICAILNGNAVCPGGVVDPDKLGPLSEQLQDAGFGYQGDALGSISQQLKDAGVGVEEAPSE